MRSHGDLGTTFPHNDLLIVILEFLNPEVSRSVLESHLQLHDMGKFSRQQTIKSLRAGYLRADRRYRMKPRAYRKI